MTLAKRKADRLPQFDYNTPGAYFLTICVEGKQCILGSSVGGGAFDAPLVRLTKCGQIVQRYIESGNNIPGVTVDKYVVMPNHIHIMLFVDKTASCGTSWAPSPTNAVIPHFVSTFNRFVHRDVREKKFQRSYHDHVIRGERDYLKIWEYIDSNPARWKDDCFYMEDMV